MTKAQHHSSMMPYLIGFILSLLLTFGGYYLVTNHILENSLLLVMIFTLAFVQLIVQLIFFLYLGREGKPHWQLIFLASTVAGIILTVGGSIWIMNHLNYNMTPKQMNEAILKDEGIKHNSELRVQN